MKLDKTGLESWIFDGFADSSDRRYIYINNMDTGVSRWSKSAVEDFGLPGEYMEEAEKIVEAQAKMLGASSVEWYGKRQIA